MAKYKAIGDLKDKSTYLRLFHLFKRVIGFEKTKSLLRGDSIDIENLASNSVKKHLELLEVKKKKVSKPDTNKQQKQKRSK